ncbi:hypothetical protein [Collimonas pratensis]|nr:hypothetical protein [Collimonas pratensis]
MSVSITKEVLLTPGEALTSLGITSTPDDQMIVTGTQVGTKMGIASKLDREGKVIWNYRSQQPKLALMDLAHWPDITGASVLKNGDILLCGNDTITDIASIENNKGTGISSKPVGKFIKLTANGKLIEQFNVTPSSSFDIRLADIRKCGRWGDGTYAIGSALKIFPYAGDASLPHKNKTERLLWLIRTDAQGKVMWEKLIPTTLGSVDELATPQLLAGSDLVFSAIGNGSTFVDVGDNRWTDLLRVSPEGIVKSQRQIPGYNLLVRKTGVEQPLAILHMSFLNQEHTNHKLLYLDESFATVKQRDLATLLTASNAPYFDQQNGLMLFGSGTKDGVTIPSFTRIDLADDKTEIVSLPMGRDDHYDISDAAALLSPGNFAFVRERTNSSIPGNHFATGVTLINLR